MFHKNVEMDDSTLAREIHDLDPHVIDWSNVPDYLAKEKFIKFARGCSTDHTIHFAIFINWTNYVSVLYFAFVLKSHFPFVLYQFVDTWRNHIYLFGKVAPLIFLINF